MSYNCIWWYNIVMQKLEIKKGERFGRLTIKKELKRDIKTDKHRKFLCLCDCGNEKVIDLSMMRTGHTKSCGCLQKEQLSKRSKSHGMSKTRPYRIWQGILSRTTNKMYHSYKYYGGRGIKVCDHWRKFENFWEDMKDTYQASLTIDRIDNEGDYCKENCKWSTVKEQSNNRRKRKTPPVIPVKAVTKINKNGETLGIYKSRRQCASKNGVTESCIGKRIKYEIRDNDGNYYKNLIN